MKICWANTDNFDDADVVIIGSSEAPDKIREISCIRDTYARDGQTSLGLPILGIKKKIYDYGNVKKTEIGNVINNVISKSKIPISIGGDHSISSEIIKSI